MILIPLYCNAQPINSSEMNEETTLYPYLGLNNLYGYSDSLGNVVIAPQYENTGFFHNGIALVNREGEKDILINTDNEIIPISEKYEHLNFYLVGEETVVELTHYYINRWRFWDWEFLPDLNILGGNSPQKRLFDTEVSREKHTLILVERNEKLKVNKGERGDLGLHHRLYYLEDEIVWVDDELYRLENKKVRKIAKNIVKNLTSEAPHFIQKKGGFFQVIDKNGGLVYDKKFKLTLNLELTVNTKEVVIPTESVHPYKSMMGDFYRDKQKNIFLSPDFEKPFPKMIQEYTLSHAITAEDIIKKAQVISPLDSTDRFVLVLNFGKDIYVIDTAGNWHSPEENYKEIRVVSRAESKIIYPPHNYFIENPNLPDGWKIYSIVEFHNNNALLWVETRSENERLQGVWDLNTKEWLVKPKYYSINFWTYAAPYVGYQTKENGKWGFFDLEESRVHIEESYETIHGGYWGTQNNTSRPFFIDVKSRKEYRESQ